MQISICAPVLFTLLLQHATPEQRRRPLFGSVEVEVLTGGAPPPPALVEKVQKLGFHVSHAYGLTEATGPALVCEWQPEWEELNPGEQAKMKARQGVRVLSLSGADVKDPATMVGVPRDGKTMGEVVLRGSSIMKGYLKNEEENRKAFRDGWLLTGDMGVIHPNGYVEIKDRSKDVIISGGENISSVEVEGALYRHPAVAEVAVVAMPHPVWQESPCAFVVAREGTAVGEEELLEHCRKSMAKFMVPKKVVFLPDLPKTSTGKIMKTRLREVAKGYGVVAAEAGGKHETGCRKLRGIHSPHQGSDHFKFKDLTTFHVCAERLVYLLFS